MLENVNQVLLAMRTDNALAPMCVTTTINVKVSDGFSVLCHNFSNEKCSLLGKESFTTFDISWDDQGRRKKLLFTKIPDTMKSLSFLVALAKNG